MTKTELKKKNNAFLARRANRRNTQAKCPPHTIAKIDEVSKVQPNQVKTTSTEKVSYVLINRHHVRRCVISSGRWVSKELLDVINRQLVKQLDKALAQPTKRKILTGEDVLSTWPV